jgi:hypothetical protein
MVKFLQMVILSGIPLKRILQAGSSVQIPACVPWEFWACISLKPSTELARATSDENAQLVQKVKELQVEVDVWKKALSATRTAQDDRPVVSFADPGKNVALCVIDGTRSFFSAKYTTQGEEGGRRAGKEIVQGITNHLVDDRSLQAKLFTTIYIRKTQLRNDVVANGHCTSDQFDDFLVGLNETSYLNIVEVSNKRDADKKIEGEQPRSRVNIS